MLRRIVAFASSIVMVGALFTSAPPAAAAGAPNAFAMYTNVAFMTTLGDIRLGTTIYSEAASELAVVTRITTTVFEGCEAGCPGEYPAPGTPGFAVRVDSNLYGFWTADHWSIGIPPLTVTVWNMKYDNSGEWYESWAPWDSGVPAERVESVCATDRTVSNIEGLAFLDDFGCATYEEDGGYADIVAQFTGTITSPISGVIQFCGSSDDGLHLEIGGSVIINDWVLQGEGRPCNDRDEAFGSYEFVAGRPVSIELWWFENEGGEYVALNYYDGENYVPVPASWFGGLRCGDVAATVCPTITDAGSGRVTGAPGTTHATKRATYTWLRCKSAGDAVKSRQVPRGCTVVQSRISTAARMAASPYRITGPDRRAGYLRLAVTVGHNTYYSGAYDLNP